MRGAIQEKVDYQEPGLYIYIVFPIATAFVLTFMGARILNHLFPDAYIPWFGFHVHHFAYGFFVLAAAGYLALVFSVPRAKYLIALLHGFGLGLAFDEYGMWLKLNDNDPARWSYDGFLIVMGVLGIIVSARSGIKGIKHLWPFAKPKKCD